MFIKNFVSYLSEHRSEFDIIYPSERTEHFFELLHGEYGFSRGQSIHGILRDPTVFKKQLFYGMCTIFYNNITLKQINDEWKFHSDVFPYTDGKGITFQEYFNTWSDAFQQLIIYESSKVVQDILKVIDDENYARYIDWVVTTGIIPIKETHQFPRDLSLNVIMHNLHISRITQRIIQNRSYLVQTIIYQLYNTHIANSNHLMIYVDRRTHDIRCVNDNKNLRVFVYTTPIYHKNGISLTTVLSHLFKEIIRSNNLHKHQKLCQLLNTFPVKVLTTSKHEINTKKIMDIIDKEEKASDAKKHIIKFLLNMSGSRSKIGIEDSVESFLQDITPSIIDHDKLMPSREYSTSISNVQASVHDKNVKAAFKRQILKCMEEQIQSQVEEIHALKKMNEINHSKINELQQIIEQYGHPLNYDVHLNYDFDLIPLATALNKTQNIPFHAINLDEGRTAANSFLTQYVPDTEYSDKRLDRLWELQYYREFKLHRNVTNQGDEDTIEYSNHTVELLILPYLLKILNLKHVDLIPAKYMSLSFLELSNAIFSHSKAKHYLNLIRAQELSRAPYKNIGAEPAKDQENDNRPNILGGF